MHTLRDCTRLEVGGCCLAEGDHVGLRYGRVGREVRQRRNREAEATVALAYEDHASGLVEEGVVTETVNVVTAALDSERGGHGVLVVVDLHVHEEAWVVDGAICA